MNRSENGVSGQDLQALLQEGLRAHQAGQLPDAEAAYRRVLGLDADHADANHLLGVIAHQVGDHGAAVELIGKAIRHDPSTAAYHCNLGNALHELDRLDEAATSQRQAIALNPDYAKAHNNLANALLAQGRSIDAVASYQKALSIAPDDAEIHANLGIALHELDRLDEAEASYRKALALNPDYAEAHTSLGATLQETGRLDEAVVNHRRAIALNPDYAEAHTNLGNALREAGRLEDAIASYRKAIALDPDLSGAHTNLGNVLKETGRLDDAIASHRKAIALNPDYAEAHTNLGNALREAGRLEDAAASHEKAIRLKPDLAEAHSNLGNVRQEQGRLDEAAESCRMALALNPDYAEAHNNLGFVLYELGNLDDAVDSYRKALSIKPDFANAHSNLLLTMSFMSCFDGTAVFAAACRAGTVFESPFADRRSTRHANTPDPERRLRVGYLLPSNITLAKNIEPVFKAHRRDRVSVHVYAHVPNSNEVTRRLEALADSWTFVHGLSDDQLAARIAGDGIDILVDPVGHWAGNRLLVSARKPAPIQVSYLSQGLTTGLSAMDYTIGDRWLNFDGAMQSFATEKVVELPGGFEVKALYWDLPVGEAPSMANGFITFASFNNPAKISDASLKLWAAVLDHVSEARLLIKGKWLDRPEKRAFLSKRLEDFGIPAGGVDLLGFAPGPDHLGVHNRADIMLDTIPFSGGQTTIDALWMGVPVVTLIGDTVYGRFSYSHLARTGVPELAAKDEAGFIDIAAALAGDPDRLGHYRQTLRPALQASSLLDAHQHTAELEDAFRVMWRRWCDGLEPEAFNGFDKSGP